MLDGVGFSAIGRLKLLQLLQQRARSVASFTFGKLVESLAEVGEADLVVGADGLNSAVRRACEGDFKTSLSYADNKFAWYGTTKAFATLSQTFVETDLGTFNAHRYRYAPGASTFLVECDRKTWDRYGFAKRPSRRSKAICEKVFARTLDGHQLISNKSVWRISPGCGTSVGTSATWCWSAMRCIPRISPLARARGSPWKTSFRWSKRWRRKTTLSGSCPLRGRAAAHRRCACGSLKDQRRMVRAFPRAHVASAA